MRAVHNRLDQLGHIHIHNEACIVSKLHSLICIKRLLVSITLFSRQGKIHFYLWLVASESVESQRRGIVFVTIQNPSLSDSTTTGSTSSNHGENFSDLQEQSRLPSIEFLKLSMVHRQALPIRMSAYHLCTPDTPFYGVLQSLITAVMTGERCRVKVHVGT